MSFKIKIIIAWIFDFFGISDLLLNRIYKKHGNQYIRILNYHDTVEKFADNFEKQLQWFDKCFSNVLYDQFEAFMLGKDLKGDKPGLMITFDDGLKGNYDVAFPLLEKYKFTGYFMCSSDLVDMDGYMSCENLSAMVKQGHIIGDHTATHHRMLETDSEELLKYEIVDSKRILGAKSGSEIEIFCWCGGEEEHYTKKAQSVINSAGFKYAFMTNSDPVTHRTNPLQIQRINIEDSWPIYLVKLQLCGFMDKYFRKKRERVIKKLFT